MKRLTILSACLLSFVTRLAFAGDSTHWSYSGSEDPQHWGKLNPKFSVCGTGKNQSPIDLVGLVEAELAPIQFDYKPGGSEVLNNGHTIQVNYDAGSRIQVDGRDFELKQFHFHVSSENHIDGQSFPMEVHLVHADEDGNLAVISVMYEEGGANTGIENPWAAMPRDTGGRNILEPKAAADSILPKMRDYYRFNGSLTTPPCSEGVIWLVMKQTVSASREQISQFSKVIGHSNNRPIKPINARVVLK